MNFFRDVLEFCLFVIVIVAVGLVILVPPVTFVSYKSCHSIERVTGNRVEWDFWQGCFIEFDGDWLTREQYESVMVARKGLLREGE